MRAPILFAALIVSLALSAGGCTVGRGPEPVGYCEWATKDDAERAQLLASSLAESAITVVCAEDMLVAQFDASLRAKIFDRVTSEAWVPADLDRRAYCVPGERRAIVILPGGPEFQFAKNPFC